MTPAVPSLYGSKVKNGLNMSLRKTLTERNSRFRKRKYKITQAGKFQGLSHLEVQNLGIKKVIANARVPNST